MNWEIAGEISGQEVFQCTCKDISEDGAEQIRKTLEAIYFRERAVVESEETIEVYKQKI